MRIRSIHSERGGGDRGGREEEQRTHVLEVRPPAAGAVRLSWMLTAQMENASRDVTASVTQARPLARDPNLVLGLLMKAISCSPKSMTGIDRMDPGAFFLPSEFCMGQYPRTTVPVCSLLPTVLSYSSSCLTFSRPG